MLITYCPNLWNQLPDRLRQSLDIWPLLFSRHLQLSVLYFSCCAKCQSPVIKRLCANQYDLLPASVEKNKPIFFTRLFNRRSLLLVALN